MIASREGAHFIQTLFCNEVHRLQIEGTGKAYIPVLPSFSLGFSPLSVDHSFV